MVEERCRWRPSSVLIAVGALGAATLAGITYTAQHQATEVELERHGRTRFSKLSLISAPLDFATQRMNKALEGAGVRGRLQGLDRYEINVAGNNALPSSCAFGGPPCMRAPAPPPPLPPSPPPGVSMSKSVNMLGFGQLVSGGGSGGKTVTEAELNSRIRYLEHTISSLADEVKFIKHDRGPRGRPGPMGMDGRNGLNGVPGKDGRDGHKGPPGKEGGTGAEGKRGKQGTTGLSSGGGWTMQIFKGRKSFSSVPDLTTLSYVGSKRVPLVNFPSLKAFREALPETPTQMFVWRFSGKVAVNDAGKYDLCTRSNTRSRVFVDNKFLFENLQINKQNCKSVYLTSGGKGFMHAITVDGFYNGGEENTGGVVLLWQGPGTQNKLRLPTNYADLVRAGDAIVPEVAFSGQGAGTLASFVTNTPPTNLAWQAWGQLRVFKGGEYRFCSLSVDGSSLRIDTQLVVNNDGVHAAKSVCANTNLVPGVHSITAEGFKGTRASLEMKLTYSGPDTGGLSEAVRSVGTRDPPAPNPSEWLLRVYRGSSGVRYVPADLSKFQRVGEAVLPTVDLSGNGGAGDFGKWVAASPRSNLVFEVFGKLRIASAGDYRLCITSKDGSKLYVDGNLIVSNDDVHGPQERCGASALKTGVHLIKAVGFHGDGPVRLLLQYAGPDTGGKRAVMQSLDSSPF